ncbi:hypothetical protein A2967_01845 [Candidatus Daviesbacteria bacterium RIFCSPLOWO2_01_FULL_41_32]|nr:MAG: hypothetical protein A2967_01845 [Candidatus Daviesbacteria bacterium RIFCSPLOWO2_01_FULL_41_32]
MSLLDKITAFLPLGKKEENKEYFFAINIGAENLAAALWTIEGKELKILETASDNYSSLDEIITVTDKLLDQVLGLREVEPQKILFGVPHSWLIDDNLKDEYLKILRKLVKELELVPMAYVATSNALIHFLEKQEGVPPTSILVGFEKRHLSVTVVRAGKLDGVKVITRGESSASDIEKALLNFTDIETLPSKILIYGPPAAGLKNQLLSFSWMSKLSFLHFPKIDVLEDEIEIKGVCLAGGSETKADISYIDRPVNKQAEQVGILEEETETVESDEPGEGPKDQKTSELEEKRISESEESEDSEAPEKGDNFGFVVGDIAEQAEQEEEGELLQEQASPKESDMAEDEENLMVPEQAIPVELASTADNKPKRKFNFKKFIPKSFISPAIILAVVGIVGLLLGVYIFLLKAEVKIFVEPKIVEKDAQVVADPNQKTVNEDTKIIPGQMVEVEVSGSAKDSASGKKQIGDPAKGTIIIYNKTFSSQSLSKGTAVNSGGIKFTLDTGATIASQSASDSGITFGKTNVTVTAVSIGADGNLSSGSDFTIAGFTSDKVAAKSEGNFSGGTSKDVTVVSSDDQQRLLAKLSSDLKQQAQQKLQEKFPDKKVLQEALLEQITSKKYNKNINDQAGEFSLSMTIRYKGTAFEDKDLKLIVSKLVNTQVPEGFELDLSGTETQSDVSKMEKDGKLIFLARFKAKMMPKIDTEKIKSQIKFKTLSEAGVIIKEMENVLGSEINLSPKLPEILQRLPIIAKNIKIEVGLK